MWIALRRRRTDDDVSSEGGICNRRDSIGEAVVEHRHAALALHTHNSKHVTSTRGVRGDQSAGSSTPQIPTPQGPTPTMMPPAGALANASTGQSRRTSHQYHDAGGRAARTRAASLPRGATVLSLATRSPAAGPPHRRREAAMQRGIHMPIAAVYHYSTPGVEPATPAPRSSTGVSNNAAMGLVLKVRPAHTRTYSNLLAEMLVTESLQCCKLHLKTKSNSTLEYKTVNRLTTPCRL